MSNSKSCTRPFVAGTGGPRNQSDVAHERDAQRGRPLTTPIMKRTATRTVAILAAAAAAASLPLPVAAQGFGKILGEITKEALGDSTPNVRRTPRIAREAGELSNHWRSSTRSRFHHLLERTPGRYRLTIHATTTSPGGETVAVYPQTRGGERGSRRIGFVIATTVGNSEEMFVTIPPPPEGEALGRLPIIVDVENASGREYSGSYSLELSPAS